MRAVYLGDPIKHVRASSVDVLPTSHNVLNTDTLTAVLIRRQTNKRVTSQLRQDPYDVPEVDVVPGCSGDR